MADYVILGENARYSTDSEVTGINNNVLVCGGSGTGKTMSITEPRLLETFDTNLIVTVTKRRIVEKYTPLLERRGYKVLDLNFAEPEKSTVGFDPMDYLHTFQDITYLAESIVKAGKSERSNADPFWDQNAVSLLSAEIGYYKYFVPKSDFSKVLNMQAQIKCGSGISSEGREKGIVDRRFEDVARRHPRHQILNCWHSFCDLAPSTAASVYSTLNTTMDTIFTPEVRTLFTRPEKIDFKKVAREKTILFVTSSPVNPALQSFVNLFYSYAFKELFEIAEKEDNGQLPIPCHLICDDFATGSKIPHFVDYISIFREKGISTTLLLQSEMQLSSMYGETEALTIINNCDSYVYLGGNDLHTASSIGLRLDKPRSEILYMPIGTEYLFRRGAQPIKTKRFDIRKNKTYKEVMEEYQERKSSAVKQRVPSLTQPEMSREMKSKIQCDTVYEDLPF